jgi:uncharacterized protein YbgA (DUF1722 family)/uncharacterized protein YbbK (DUF523 family)
VKSRIGPQDDESPPIRVGISSCLLGQKVRYDGGHKHDRFLTGTFGRFVEWVGVCPEVEAGMGIPRESIHLSGTSDAPRLVGTKTGTDHTDAMRRYSDRRARALEQMDLCGYVLKRDSPSCGMERVRVFSDKAMPQRNGRGLFAEVLIRKLPLLPVEEEGRLNDPPLRENFIERIFAYRRLRNLFSGRWTARRLVEFHTAHKLQIMAHSPVAYRDLGRLVASVKRVPRAQLREQYERGFMDALAKKATPGRNRNVLEHMLGYFRDELDPESRAEIAALIRDYHAGFVPLVVPLSLIGHYVRKLRVTYLLGQTYLEPHPKELMLRNHV